MSEWISVRNRLPELNEYVLVCTELKWISVARMFSSDDGCPYQWISEDSSYIDSRWITHWMPLPEPPNEP